MISTPLVNGKPAHTCMLSLPYSGPWIAECVMLGDDAADGAVTLELGAVKLAGTTNATRNGTFGQHRALLIVGGSGNFDTVLPSKHYHNDLGVKARNVAADILTAIGAQVGTQTAISLAADYVRQAGPASRTLDDVAPGWWVGLDGKVNLVARASGGKLADTAHVLNVEPRNKYVDLSIDELADAPIGATISNGVDSPLVIRQLTIDIDHHGMKARAWCGGSGGSQLSGLLDGIAQRAAKARLHGLYKYRVVQMQSDRVALQVVSKATGLPDVLPISLWPGSPSTHAQLALGAYVGVQFFEGDRSQPIVTAFAGRDSPGHVAAMLELGGVNGAACARQGDTVEILLPPLVVSGSMIVGGMPTPFTGVAQAVMAKTQGSIISGSGKVKVAT